MHTADVRPVGNVFLRTASAAANPGKPLIIHKITLLVRIPDLAEQLPLEVNYNIGKSGITWDLALDMEVEADGILDCSLLATINTQEILPENAEYILAKRPEVTLISSQNIFLENSNSRFSLGNPLIEPSKSTFLKLDGGKAPYRLGILEFNSDIIPYSG